ncbi:MAG: hypothetical protein K2X08_03265, partial [Chlamydiales bacterium]|nr:hypothetical protein [Chlamydiales bacterium]
MHDPFPDYAQMANLPLIEELYKKYLENPVQVEPSWRFFFQGIDFSRILVKSPSVLRIFLLIQSYRRFGHLAAHINPLQEAPAFPVELNLQNL